MAKYDEFYELNKDFYQVNVVSFFRDGHSFMESYKVPKTVFKNLIIKLNHLTKKQGDTTFFVNDDNIIKLSFECSLPPNITGIEFSIGVDLRRADINVEPELNSLILNKAIELIDDEEHVHKWSIAIDKTPEVIERERTLAIEEKIRSRMEFLDLIYGRQSRYLPWDEWR